jgi:arginyl-tRNA synthetase
MKDILISAIDGALNTLVENGTLPSDIAPKIHIERTRDAAHGDFASNIALMLAKPAKMSPRDVATQIVNALSDNEHIVKTEIAGPGFINFYLKQDTQSVIVKTVLEQQERFGTYTQATPIKLNVEFVSANPTGPLHVGHGRGAAYGSVLSKLLRTAGFDVTREYYVNDAGRQMDILAVSTWLRYLALQGIPTQFPLNGYQGDYIIEIARELKDLHTATLSYDGLNFAGQAPIDVLVKAVKALENDEAALKPVLATLKAAQEAHIDDLITQAKAVLGLRYDIVHSAALNWVLDDIKEDLHEFNVDYENWFSEKSLMTGAKVQHALDALHDKGLTYEKKGAIWFKATDFGDDKDRVLVRDNGQTTYFASDAAYLLNKFERGFDEAVYIFGADHHGYVPRLRALLDAFGFRQDQLNIPLVQFAVLYKDGKKLSMSTRSGQFVTLRDLREEVGNDATRFFYVMRKSDQHLDFDLDLAKSQSNDNPVYYIQYAHARICSVTHKMQTEGLSTDASDGIAHLSLLTTEHEAELFKTLAKYPEMIAGAAKNFEPHQIGYYLLKVANQFHAYYNQSQFIVDDNNVRLARLALITAVRQVLSNGLSILDVSAPEQM